MAGPVVKVSVFDGVIVMATWDESSLTLVGFDPPAAERFATGIKRHASEAATWLPKHQPHGAESEGVK
jgi:hypothetical protein